MTKKRSGLVARTAAIAVAAGVSAAVATSPGVAQADTSAPQGAETSSQLGEPPAAGDNTDPVPLTDEITEPATEPAPTTEPTPEPTTGPATQTEPVTQTEPTSDNTETGTANLDPLSPGDNTADEPVEADAETEVAPLADEPPPFTAPVTDDESTPQQITSTDPTADAVTYPGPDVAATATPRADVGASEVAPPIIAALAPARTAVEEFVASALAAIGLGPLAPDSPAPPAGAPLGLALLAWVRRQTNATFFNFSPTASPVQISQTLGGVVTGTIGAADRENDQLVYEVVSGPTKGSLQIRPDGTFTYTPGPDLADTGGTDTFTVRVSDIGPHLHLLNGDGTVTVPVTIAVVTENTAPVAGTSAIGAADPATGVIGGSVNAVDAESNPLTYTVYGQPSRGTVQVASDGTFVYTPTQAARLLAGGSTDPLLDAFAVSVTDGGSDPVIVVVKGLTVAPMKASVNQTSPAVGDWPFGLALNADGSRAYVVNGDGNTVSVLDTATGQVVATVPVGADPYGIALNSNGTRAYVVNSTDNSVTVIDTTTNTVTGSPIGVGLSPTGIAISDDGTRAYVTNTGSGTVSVIDTTRGVVIGTITAGNDPFGIVLSSDGDRAYVTNETDGTVWVVDTATGTKVTQVSVGTQPTGIAISADGTRVYVVNSGSMTRPDDSSVSVINTATNTVIGNPIAVGEFAIGIAVSPDDSLVYVTSHGYDSLTVIDTATRTVINDFVIGDAPTGVAVSPDGTRVFVARSGDDRLSVIDLGIGGGTLTATSPSTPSPVQTTNPVQGAVESEYSTSGFDVINGTSKPLVFTGYRGQGVDLTSMASAPAVGTILQPGQSAHFEVNYYYFGDDVQYLPVFETVNSKPSDPYVVVLLATRPVEGRSDWACDSVYGGMGCVPLPQSGEQRAVLLLDSAETDVTITDANSAQQSAILNALCGTGLADCTFTATGIDYDAWTDVEGFSFAVLNNTAVDVSSEVTHAVVRTDTSSVDVTTKTTVDVFEVVKEEIQAKYGETWAESYQVSGSSGIIALPSGVDNHTGWVRLVRQEPVKRVTGDFTVTVADRTFNLTGVHFDVADPSRQGETTAVSTPVPGWPPATTAPSVSVPPPAINPGQGSIASGNQTEKFGFNVVNASSKAITYTGYAGQGEGLSYAPAVGTVLAPGQSAHFEVASAGYLQTASGTTHWTDGVATYEVDLVSEVGGNPPVVRYDITCDNASGADCQVVSDSGSPTAYLLDPPGTTVVIPPDRLADSAALIERMCGLENATCRFDVTGEEYTLGNPRGLEDGYHNTSEAPVTRTIIVSHGMTNSTNIDLTSKASFDVMKVISEEVTAHYSQTWATTDTVTQTIKTTIPVDDWATVTAYDPVHRVHGNFVITLSPNANMATARTYVLEGIYFDDPDPNGQGVYVVNNAPPPTAL